MNKEIRADSKYLLEVTEFEVSLDCVLNHFANFRMSNLPNGPSTMLKHIYVVVKWTEEIVHVFIVIREG